MIDAKQLADLLQKPESATLDFKQEQYRLEPPSDARGRGCLNLVKDILCMSNTPRQGSAYLLTGVDNQPGRRNTVVGIDSHVDDNIIQSLLRAWLNPIPQVSYSELEYEGKWVGVYEISMARMQGPFFLSSNLKREQLKNCGDFLKPDLLYYRRGTTNDWARETDKEYLTSWFRSHNEKRWQDWDEFKRCCDYFSEGRHFVLITSSMSHIEQSSLRSFATIGWSAVIDFDISSDETGILNAISEADYQRNIIRCVKGEARSFSPFRETYWFFARGTNARQETLTRKDNWRTWRALYGSEINHQFEHIARELLPAPVTFVVVWNDDLRTRYLSSTLEATSVYADANYVVVSDTATHLEATIDDYDAHFFEIPVVQLASGLEIEFSNRSRESIEYTLPSHSGTPILLPTEKITWLQSQLDIVHRGLSAATQTQQHGSDDDYNFLTGGTVSWRELDLGKDAARDVTSKLIRVLRQELGNRDTSRVDVFHRPGAGGTTVARRALWDLHQDYPSVVIRSSDARSIAERVEYIGTQTNQTVLALVDSADIAEREIEDLHEILQSRRKDCVLLCVSRRHTLPSTSRRVFTLESQLSRSELPRFTDRFIASAPDRKTELSRIGQNSSEQQTAFYYGLTAYGQDYKGLESYVARRIEDLSDVQLAVLAYLSIAYKYGQRGIAAQAFQNLLGLSHRDVSVPQVFSEKASVLDILIEEGNAKEWRPIHHVVADELVQQILTPESSDRRVWRQHLSTWGKQFIEFCATHNIIVSNRILDLLRRVFIYRDTDDALGRELDDANHAGVNRISNFSQFIRDTPSREGRLEVLRFLAETIPDEAHFWAHLGRFQSAVMENHIASLEAVERAVALQPNDPLLWHMKGMCYRYHVQKLMIDSSTSLEAIVDIAKKASECFAESRILNPDNDHAYVSEIQLLAKVLNFAVRDTEESIFEYMQKRNALPYLREAIDKAESLLAIVRANREGRRGSSYEEDCRAKLRRIYGDYQEALQIWDGLLSRHDVFHPPVRRQIVYAHINRADTWGLMPQRNRDRCIQLLQDNLDQEPYNARDLRLWLQAVRFASSAPSIESLIEKISYWKANSNALDATYYLYVLYWLRAFEGLTNERVRAERFIREAVNLSQNRRNRFVSFEWLGSGSGVGKLVHQSTLGNWNPETNFWSNASALERVNGVITEVRGPQQGRVQVSGMSCFFVPGAKRENPISRDSVNQRVDFFVGFSYAGVRAWDVKLL